VLCPLLRHADVPVGVNKRTTCCYALIRLVNESSKRDTATNVNDGAMSSFGYDRSCVEDRRSESLAFTDAHEKGLRRLVIFMYE
jgi:hypothetical protein